MCVLCFLHGQLSLAAGWAACLRAAAAMRAGAARHYFQPTTICRCNRTVSSQARLERRLSFSPVTMSGKTFREVGAHDVASALAVYWLRSVLCSGEVPHALRPPCMKPVIACADVCMRDSFQC